MTVYADIPGAEIAIDQAVKSSTATKFRDNPLAIFEGDPTAIAAGKGVAVEFDSGGGSQTALITDELDTDKIIRPDGAGGFVLSATGLGLILVERKELAAAVTTVTFAGLLGDTHEVYRLIGRINKSAAAASIISLQANAGAIGGLRHVTDGAAAANNVLGALLTTQGFATFFDFDILIHAREVVQAVTFPRLWQGKAVEYNPPANVPMQVVDFGALWTGAGNIVSLGLTGSVALSFGIGSTLELFKYAQA